MTVRGYRDGRILTVMDQTERESTDRTGRPAQFSAEDAIAAALDLGIAEFSMAQVARRLGVTAPPCTASSRPVTSFSTPVSASSVPNTLPSRRPVAGGNTPKPT